MNTSTPIFSNDPSSTSFNSMIGTHTGRKAKLGDPADMDMGVAASVKQAHSAIENGMSKIARLAEDETRSTPEKHDAARTVAEHTVTTLKNTQSALRFHADQMLSEAQRVVDERFAPASDGYNAFQQYDVSKWIGEQAKKKDGLATIKREMKSDPDIAIALIHGKSYLMGLTHEVRMSLAHDAYRQHMPNEMAKIEKAAKLQELADKYSVAMRSINKGWFNGAMAEKAKSRVTI